jgi:hypothetical protein
MKNGVDWSNGWGGPPKGATKIVGKAPRFEKNNTAGVGNLSHAAPSAVQRKVNTNLVKGRILHLALNGEAEMTQLRACETYLNREEGMPVARSLNINIDDVTAMTDEQLALREEQLRQEIETGIVLPAPPTLEHDG